MKSLVIFESVHGNTEKIAQAIADAIAGEVKLLRSREADMKEVEAAELLVLGAPTYGGRPCPDMLPFLQKLSRTDIKGKKTASFDTRLSTKWVGIFGYAAGKMGKQLQKQGAELVVEPEPFFVKGTEGPLKEGEEERARTWAKALVQKIPVG